MNKLIKVAAVGAAGMMALTGCSGGSDDDANTITVVGYSVLETANEGVFKAFEATDAGDGVEFKKSYGASGDQSRAVEAGQDADEVHLSLEPDVTRLVDAGIVADDWKDNDQGGICTQSVVVFVVQKGNPKDITGWDDLTKDGVGIVTPNPASSGSAKWNLLAAFGSVTGAGGSEDDAKSYMQDFFGNVVALPDSGRDATTAFKSGQGDVLLSYENEAILGRQAGDDFDYVIPDSTLLIQNPCALTEDAPDVAQDFLDFQVSEEGQKLYGETGYRPLTPIDGLEVEGANDPSNPFPDPKQLLTIDDDFNGWGEANDKYFGDGQDGNPLGILTEIQADTSN